MSTALNIHKIQCSGCDHEFYVELPENSDGKDTVEHITGCVECSTDLKRTYEYSYTDEMIDVELTVEAINNE